MATPPPQMERAARQNFFHLPIYDFLGLQFEISQPDRVVARMTVTEQSAQRGALHGGVSAVLAESLASVGAGKASGLPAVGLEVTCSHLRDAPIGTRVVATATPLRIGRNVQVWEVRLEGEDWAVPEEAEKRSWIDGKLIALAKMTAFVPPPKLPAARRDRGATSIDSKLRSTTPQLRTSTDPTLTSTDSKSRRGPLGQSELARGGGQEGPGSLATLTPPETLTAPAGAPSSSLPQPTAPPIVDYIGLRVELARRGLLIGRMLVGETSRQPFGALHGGVSALITEHLANLGASLSAPLPAGGLEVTCSHLRSAPVGTAIVAVASPLRAGRNIQVWEVRIHTDLLPASPLHHSDALADQELPGQLASSHWPPFLREHLGPLLAVGRCTLLVTSQNGEAEAGRPRGPDEGRGSGRKRGPWEGSEGGEGRERRGEGDEGGEGRRTSRL